MVLSSTTELFLILIVPVSFMERPIYATMTMIETMMIQTVSRIVLIVSDRLMNSWSKPDMFFLNRLTIKIIINFV